MQRAFVFGGEGRGGKDKEPGSGVRNVRVAGAGRVCIGVWLQTPASSALQACTGAFLSSASLPNQSPRREASAILSQATPASLVILDELV